MTVAVEKRQQVELADVFRVYGEQYSRTHRLSSVQLNAIRDIKRCRTEEMGGHIETCSQCGFERACYHSCRNRHCPKCQCLPKARWLEARKAELLPVRYFHVVFTIPHELNGLALYNKKEVYTLLFHCVSKTLQSFGEKTFGGKIGATMILHTWDQKLKDHIHIHCAIPSVALRCERGQPAQLIHARENFLFPVVAMAVMFRGKFLSGLRALNKGKKIQVSPEFPSLIRSLYDKTWVVYSKPAFKGAESVLNYIGRYTHRIAISNERLIGVEKGQVTFSYRDRQDENKRKEMTLSSEEFMSRFLLHVLPSGFMKIRHMGFLSNKTKKRDLAQCRELLGVKESQHEEKTTRELLKELTGVDLDQCPSCQTGMMVITREIPKLRRDSS